MKITDLGKAVFYGFILLNNPGSAIAFPKRNSNSLDIKIFDLANISLNYMPRDFNAQFDFDIDQSYIEYLQKDVPISYSDSFLDRMKKIIGFTFSFFRKEQKEEEAFQIVFAAAQQKLLIDSIVNNNTTEIRKILKTNPALIFSSLDFVIEYNKTEALEEFLTSEYLTSDEKNYIKLCIAINENNIAKVKKIIQKKKDISFVTKYGKSPIFRAISNNNQQIVKELIKYKADVNFALKQLLKSSLDQVNFKSLSFFLQILENNPKYSEEILKKELLLLKLLAHSADISNTKFLNRVDLNLEGFHSSLTSFISDNIFLITQAFFEEFSEYKNHLDIKKILDSLSKSKSTLKEGPSKLFKKIQKSDSPTIFHCSWPHHAFDIVFYKDYLLICNKGSRPEEMKPIEAYKINKDAAKFKYVIETLRSDLSYHLHHNIYQFLQENLEIQRDDICKNLSSLILTDQKIGNCAWESKESSLAAIIALDLLLKNNNGEESIKISNEIMDKWRLFAPKYLLNKYENFHEENPEIYFDKNLFNKVKTSMTN